MNGNMQSLESLTGRSLSLLKAKMNSYNGIFVFALLQINHEENLANLQLGLRRYILLFRFQRYFKGDKNLKNIVKLILIFTFLNFFCGIH